MTIQSYFNNALENKKPLLAVLIDPDKVDNSTTLITTLEAAKVDLIFVGGSILVNGNIDETVAAIKKQTTIPVVLFPGDGTQVAGKADGILLLSLISGRNPEYLIGQQIKSAVNIKKSGLEVLPTGYILIYGGNTSSTMYISNTSPIPANKPELAAVTALAGVQLGLKNIYLEAGSGAINPVSAQIIKSVKQSIGNTPLIVGGGMRNEAQVKAAINAGANIIVVGTALEKDADLITDIANAIHSSN